jgi:predicted KAP-like P-loop ATPase
VSDFVGIRNPIQSFDEDLLQREAFVLNLCRILEATPLEESIVFALYGEWGSGKTSVKNLLKRKLFSRGDKAPRPIEFNPWAFSGQNQVLEAFFSEIGKAIGDKASDKEAGEKFKKMGAYLSFGAKSVKALHLSMDLFGIPGSKLFGMLGEQLEGGSKSAREFGEDIGTVSSDSLEKVQQDLHEALKKITRPFLIILDDLDRLTAEQLLVMFQIVKLNANLPHVNYLLLMDAETIINRLQNRDLGPEFIEKIVQFDLTLPHVTSQELREIIKEGFKFIMGKYAEQINWERWEEAWINGAGNLFTTVRRVKRFLHTFKFHFGLFEGEDVLEVDPVDLFLVETIRKFAPKAHAELPRLLGPVVMPRLRTDWLSLFDENKRNEFGKAEAERLVELVPDLNRSEVQRILQILFPQITAGNYHKDQEDLWMRDARICHHFFFDSYFRLAIASHLPTQGEITKLFQCASNQDQLRPALKQIYDKIGLNSLLERIQCHHKNSNPRHFPSFSGNCGDWTNSIRVLRELIMLGTPEKPICQ